MPKAKTTKPNATEYKALTDYLKTQGFKPADIDAFLGTSVSNRNRAEIAEQIAAHLKGLKKKQK